MHALVHACYHDYHGDFDDVSFESLEVKTFKLHIQHGLYFDFGPSQIVVSYVSLRCCNEQKTPNVIIERMCFKHNFTKTYLLHFWMESLT